MRPDRLWQFGGALCAVVLAAFGWFFFINSEYKNADDIRQRTADANDQVAVLQQRLKQLRTDNENLPKYKAELAADLAALPTTDSVANLLRELQSAGELTGVTVSGVTVGAALDLKTSAATVHTLPISLNVAGPTAKINPFLDQLQKIQPRAVLISTVNLAPGQVAGATDRTIVTINLQAFYASGS